MGIVNGSWLYRFETRNLCHWRGEETIPTGQYRGDIFVLLYFVCLCLSRSNKRARSLEQQLLANVVLATDIVDKELKELRNGRWEKAFHSDDVKKPTALISREEVNRKATIVLEHIIQASDISHTMQVRFRIHPA